VAEIFKVELNVWLVRQELPGDVESGFACVYAVQVTYSLRKKLCPTARTTASIKSDRIVWKILPRENRRVVSKHLLKFVVVK